MKIGVLDYETIGDDIDLSILSQFGEIEIYSNLSRADILEKIEDKDIIVINKVKIDKEFINKAKRLKMIAISATGYNNIDISYADEKGIKVYNVADYSTDSVVQHTFAMALSMICHLNELNRYIKSKEYSKSKNMTRLDLKIPLLSKMKWGIIGMGDIGKGVAKIAKAFGAEVIYMSPKLEIEDYKRVSLEELLRQSDIVSIHCPLNKDTKGLLKYEQFKMMKKNAIIINVARGGIINENDLYRALKEELISGACLDVFETEPIEENNKMLSLSDEKIIMTPHTAWASVDSRNLLVEGIYENIKSFLENGNRIPVNNILNTNDD